jgi:hypothetical protein
MLVVLPVCACLLLLAVGGHSSVLLLSASYIVISHVLFLECLFLLHVYGLRNKHSEKSAGQ